MSLRATGAAGRDRRGGQHRAVRGGGVMIGRWAGCARLWLLPHVVRRGGGVGCCRLHQVLTRLDRPPCGSHRATFSTISKVRRRTPISSRARHWATCWTRLGQAQEHHGEKVDSIETTLAHVAPEMTLEPAGTRRRGGVHVRAGLAHGACGARHAAHRVRGPVTGMMKDYDRWYAKTVQAGEDMSTTAVEYVNGIEVIKAFGFVGQCSYEKLEDDGKLLRALVHRRPDAPRADLP